MGILSIVAKQAVKTEGVGPTDLIRRVQAVVEYTMDGRVLTANDKFLNLLGYSLEEMTASRMPPWSKRRPAPANP